MAVQGHDDIFFRGLQDDVDIGVIGQNNRPVGEGMGTDRGQDDHTNGRVNNRAAGREGISGRTGRRGNDQAVGFVGTQILLIDPGFEVKDTGQRAFVNHHIVQDLEDTDRFVVARQRRLQQAAPLNLKISLQHPLQGSQEFIGRCFGQKTQIAQIDPQNRDLTLIGPPGNAQERAVAAEHNSQVCALHDLDLAPAPAEANLMAGVVLGPNGLVALLEPSHHLTAERGDFWLIAFDDQPDVFPDGLHIRRGLRTVKMGQPLAAFLPAQRIITDMPTQHPDLFAHSAAKATAEKAPLAERMRPRTIDEYVGQAQLLGPGRVLRQMIEGRSLSSLILWGPPGSGKTSLANLLVRTVGAPFASFSAVLSGVKDLRQVLDQARYQQQMHATPTVVFVDEIHRFNKSQQDAFLPHVEQGLIILLGATTENPSFEVIPPLLSRARVLVLEALGPGDLQAILTRALQDTERGLGDLGLSADVASLTFLVQHSQGDARIALGSLEAAAGLAVQKRLSRLDLSLVEEAAQHKALRYDKGGEEHYNVISAFIKSLRGSDPDAAVYWLMRMLEAGEDPLFIVRRMVIFAAEDVGNADPQALSLALAAKDAVHFVGLPEARIPLAQAATYLATAPKSNASYAAMKAALSDVQQHGPLPVPLHLRNAPSKLMRGLGYGKGYQYAHDHADAVIDQQHLPDALTEQRYYHPSDRGHEKTIQQRMDERARRRQGE